MVQDIPAALKIKTRNKKFNLQKNSIENGGRGGDFFLAFFFAKYYVRDCLVANFIKSCWKSGNGPSYKQ